MTDVWAAVERWNAARDAVGDEPRLRELLERHAVWVTEGIELRSLCDVCETRWPCKVFTEIEMVL